MASQVVSYEVDADTVVRIEIEPSELFRPVGAEQVVGRVRDAVLPAVEAARAVLDRVVELAPAQVEVRFGVKVTGEANWLLAKLASEGNFEVTLTWQSSNKAGHGNGTENEAEEARQSAGPIAATGE